MARICLVHGKRPQSANNVSHTNMKTKRWLYPNVQKITFVRTQGGKNKVERGNVCTKCIKAGKVQKVI